MAYFNMTVPHDRFSIDNQPTKVQGRIFDGKDLDLIVFVDADTGAISHERSATIELFGFNGTAVLTPCAFNNMLKQDVHDINEDSLEGNLLVLELEKGVAYGHKELKQLLYKKGVVDEEGEKEGTCKISEKQIVLFKTGIMDTVLANAVKDGMVDYGELAKTQEGRPGITAEGARYLSYLNFAKAFAVDNISFETKSSDEGSKEGFIATQILMCRSMPYFRPLVYHVARTTDPEFEGAISGKTPYARIELGNIPAYRPLPGYPVAFKVMTK